MTNKRQFKNVNTEWINRIPIELGKRKFSKSIKRLSTGLNPRDNFTLNDPGANLYYVTIRNFKNRELYLNDKCDMITQEAWNVIQKRSKLEKGDILFASISEDGQAYLLEEEPTNWNINESVFCIKIDNTVFNSKYFTYLITNQVLYKSLRKDATGTTFLSIKQNQLKDCSLVVPPLDEQQLIVNFLDHKISNIDEAISRNNQMIEKLEEYKKSVISRAVTKGLKENIEMKDTQNEWIKEIPANWNVFRIRHLIKNGASGIKVGPFGSALKGKMLGEGEYKVYNQANLIQNDFDFSRHFISVQTFKELSNYEVKPNDILFSVMGTIRNVK